ncbi:hypothetical protein SCA6_007176 [Theobroma cacao]
MPPESGALLELINFTLHSLKISSPHVFIILRELSIGSEISLVGQNIPSPESEQLSVCEKTNVVYCLPTRIAAIITALN